VLKDSEGGYNPAVGPVAGPVSKIDMPDTQINFPTDLAQFHVHSFSEELVSTEDNM